MRHAIWTICTLLLTSLVTGLVGAPAPAQADTGTGTGGNSGSLGLTKTDFADLAFLNKNEKGEWVYMNKTTFDTFFNRKRCECNEEVMVRVKMQQTSRAKINQKTGQVRLRGGNDDCVCQGSACTGNMCQDLAPAQDLHGLINNDMDFVFKVRDLFAAGRTATTDVAATCERETNQNVWLWIDGPDSDTTSDITDTSVQVQLDGVPPPAPTGINAVGGEEALQVSWNEIVDPGDMQGYQVLCSRGEIYPPFADPPSARYETPAACAAGSNSDGGVASDAGVATDAGASDAGTSSTSAALETTTQSFALAQPAQRGAPPPLLAALDPRFVCSDLLTGTTQTRLYQLQNGIPYVVGVIAIDRRSNPSKLTEVVLQTPTQTRDFYSGYRRAGGAAEGGYCAVLPGAAADHANKSAWALLALGLLAVGLRRQRGRHQ